MDGVFLGGSLLAAFVAGGVALFAPCCITVMMPAYLAAAVKNHRWRLVPLTFVFAAGVAVVLVPVTLGLTMLSRGLLQYHELVYGAGGVLMLILAGLAATGTSWSLPLMRGAPDLQRTDSGGVFALGVFSGAASACCAPVLAGVLTLSAVTPSTALGVGVGLAYTFGMVFPLVVMTAVWDRFSGARMVLRPRTITWTAFGRQFNTSKVALLAAGLYAVMGVLLLIAAASGAELVSPAQAALAGRLEESLRPIVGRLESVPDWAVGAGLVLVAVAAAAVSGRRRSKESQEVAPAPTSGSCHDTSTH